MKEFTYTITDALGIHARPAGVLAKEAKKFQSVITVSNGVKTVKINQLMALMSMGIKQGQSVTVAADGEDEDAAIEAMQAMFQTQL